MGLRDKLRKLVSGKEEPVQEQPRTFIKPQPQSPPSEPQIPMEPVIMKSTASIKRVGTSYLGVQIIKEADNEFADTLVIQYPKSSMLGAIRSMVATKRKKNATTDFDMFRCGDTFVNLDVDMFSDKDAKSHNRKWQRIIYECMEGNKNVGGKFKDAMFIRVYETLAEPDITLARLLGGGQ